MLPIYKLLSLFLRVFSRPLINLTKRYHATNKIQNDFIRKFFFKLGTSFNAFETRINRKYLKTADAKINVKILTESVAVDKGIEFFYEIIFYSIAIGFPTYELIRGARDTKTKEKKLETRVERIEKNIDKIAEGVAAFREKLEYAQMKALTYQLITNHLIFTQGDYARQMKMMSCMV